MAEPATVQSPSINLQRDLNELASTSYTSSFVDSLHNTNYNVPGTSRDVAEPSAATMSRQAGSTNRRSKKRQGSRNTSVGTPATSAEEQRPSGQIVDIPNSDARTKRPLESSPTGMNTENY